MRRVANESIRQARDLVGRDLDVEFVVRDGSTQGDVAKVAREFGCDVIIEPRRLGALSTRLGTRPRSTRRIRTTIDS